ncbi:MAG: hypothetical protein U5K37_00295 [Natrialbaceae archaeon]|nr:hypothetical protein [Natrialbaceae archaeon]
MVGVASLAIMMNMLSGIGSLTDTEVDVEIEPPTVTDESPTSVKITVLGEDDNTITDATIIVSSGSAALDSPLEGITESDGSASIDIDPSLRQGQGTGTLEIDVVPPADTNYVDEQANTALIVIES